MSNYNTTLQSNNTDLQAILNTINELPNAGGEQATPVISVNTSGLITATAGTKSSTHQLAFQPAKTITPSTASQVAVSSGYYTGGNITVAAIPSTYVQPTGTKGIAENGTYDVKSYASVNVNIILNDEGTSAECGLITRDLTSYTNNRVSTIGSFAFYIFPNLTTVSFPIVTTIGDNAFSRCASLTTISFPAATTLGNFAFTYCYELTTISFPAVTTIGSYAFSNCSKLTTISFPTATTIGAYAFAFCSKLTTASFPMATTIGSSAFSKCYNLTSLYLTGSSVCQLFNTNAFSSTPIGGYSTYTGTYGSIYVPTSLLASYKKATNWVYLSSRFVGI